MERKRFKEINWLGIETLNKRFIYRRDVYAVQTPDGRYSCVRRPLTARLNHQHLRGEITLGIYILDPQDNARFTVMDADDDIQYYQLFKLANILMEEGIPSYMEASRRGGHLWFFHEQTVSGLEAKTFGEELLAEYKLEPMEVFPKQSTTEGGVGSLIRLPFGIHQKSGKRYPFVNISDGMPIGSFHEQLRLLKDARTVSREGLERYTAYAMEYEQDDPIYHSNDATDNVWNRIKAKENAVDFIGRYVELSPTSRGAVGHCPFHDDEHQSFSVNRDGSYWNCFAGCGGGSIIDFYMKLKNVELGEAVRELREMLEV